MGLFRRNKEANFTPVADPRTLHKNLEFTASEQYRLLRTNIMFTLPEDVKCPVIGVTSAIRGEGKSTTAVNLAYVLAEKGKRVLLIDGDLRIPSVANKMGIKGSPGLTDLLLGASMDVSDWKSEVHDNLYVLPAGEIPPNPSELLGSNRMKRALEKLREAFGYIVIDLPPINLVSDAMSAANFITGLILVIRENYTSKRDVEQCIRQIRLSNINVLGCVMNGAETGGGSYGKYKKSKYYKYRYYQTYETAPRGKKR